MCDRARSRMTPFFAIGLACVSGANLLPMLERHGWLGHPGPGLLDFLRGVLAGAGIILLLGHLVLARRAARKDTL